MRHPEEPAPGREPDPAHRPWSGALPEPIGSASEDTGEGRRANAARVYDCWLGGKDNYAVDRAVATRIGHLAPWIPAGARANRAFLERAVGFATRAGIRQFLDIGSGLPTVRNVHEIAGDIVPDIRVVYVDNDPVACARARALLARAPGVSAVLADARSPGTLLERAIGTGGLDLERPVAVLLVAVLHFLSDSDDPAALLDLLRQALTPGSLLVISHPTPVTGRHGAATRRAVRAYQEHAVDVAPRTREQIHRFLSGWELLPPGLVGVDQWRPVTRRRPTVRVPMLAGTAKLPGGTAPVMSGGVG